MAVIIGHRGARGEKSENTIEGFLHAARVGVPIETDIAVTADFIPVMHHDPTIPDGRLIRDLPFNVLQNIPTLAESLAALPDQEWFLEIKTYPPTPEKSHPPAVMAARVLEVLAGTRTNLSRIAIKAFDWEVLREVARREPHLRRVCLTSPGTEAAREVWWGRGVTAADTPEAVAATGAYGWSAFHESLTVAQVESARSMGLKVFAWTVNEKQDFGRNAPLVDGVITDFPTRLSEWQRAGP